MTKEEHFKARGTFIRIWKIRAQELYEAAEAVWNTKVLKTQLKNGSIDETHLLSRPAQLLMGLSLEAAIKGLTIQNDNSLLDEGKLNRKLKTHSLKDLFVQANIAVNNQGDMEFLERLSASVVWASKYPIPTEAKGAIEAIQKFLIGNDNDFNSFDRLYREILASLKD